MLAGDRGDAGSGPPQAFADHPERRRNRAARRVQMKPPQRRVARGHDVPTVRSLPPAPVAPHTFGLSIPDFPQKPGFLP